MKENNFDESKNNIRSSQGFNARKSRDTMSLKASLYENRKPFQNKTTYKKGESNAPFERILNNKLELEEKEKKLRMEIKQKKKLIRKVNKSIRKDYILFFFLFLSSSFNFNYLFLPYIFLGTIYLSCLGNFNMRPKKLKYLFEIFIIGYTSYLLLFKIIVYSLIKNGNEYVITDKKDLFIDLGNCILKDLDSNFYFTMNFLPEILIILSSGYGIYISFICRLLTPNDLKEKNITNFKLSKYVFIIYILMICCTMFNLSYLSLIYILCNQIILFLCSIKYKENVIKKLLKNMIYLIILLSALQIIIMNILNIPSINSELFNENQDILDNKKYIIIKQIGLNINDNEQDTKDIIINFVGYFFSIIALLILINTNNKLRNEEKQENIEDRENGSINNNNSDNKINKLVFKKSIFYKIINNIIKFLYHPVFNFEVSRILSILWTYFYRNLFSFGILIFIFISFFSPHTKRNKCLVIFILSPMVLLSLSAFHISNITGNFTNLTKEDEVGYARLGLKKYDIVYLEYPIGHLFFIIVMFLINSVYTYEALQEEENEIYEEKVVEMQDLGSSNRLDESILSKDDNEENKIRVNRTMIDSNNYNINDSRNESDSSDSDKNIILVNSGNNRSSISNLNRIGTQRTNKDINTSQKLKKNVSIKRAPTKYTFDISFISLIKKLLLKHIDKITLIVMYFVSVYTVNAIHVILVLILVFQIIMPLKLNYCYKFNIIFFQLLYIIEFIVDLFKAKYYEQFKEYKNLLEFLIVYDEDLYSNDIEIFIYGVIYCFYFQYRTCNIESNKELLNDNKISLGEYIKLKLKNYPTIQSIIFAIGSILSHIYLWFLICIFIFFNSFYEINFIFGIKLFLFLLCCLQFIFLFQAISNSYSDIRCFKIINRIFLIFCCLNTLAVYIYQFLCKDLLNIKENILKKREEDHFFMKNLLCIKKINYIIIFYHIFCPLLSQFYLFLNQKKF